MAYTEEELNAAKIWYRNFLQALQKKGVDLKNPLSLSRIQVFRKLPDEEPKEPDEGTPVEELIDQIGKNNNLFSYAFTGGTAENGEFKPVHPGEDSDIIDFLQEKTETPEKISNDHIMYLYEMAKANRLYYRDYDYGDFTKKPVHYIRVLSENVQHDESGLLKKDADHIIKKSGEPVIIGNACIDRDFGAYYEYDNKVLTELAKKMTDDAVEEQRRKLAAKGIDPNNHEQIAANNEIDPFFILFGPKDEEVKKAGAGDLLELQNYFTQDSYHALAVADDKISYRYHLNNMIAAGLASRLNDPSTKGSAPAIRKALKNSIQANANSMMLYYAAQYPEYFRDRKNRKAFKKAAEVIFTPEKARTGKDIEYLRKFKIVNDQYLYVVNALKKEFHGKSIREIMKSGRIRKADGSDYPKNDPFLFMNAVCRDISNNGIYLRAENDGDETERFVSISNDLGLQDAISLDDYRKQFIRLRKELEATDNALSKDSPEYQKLCKFLKAAEKTLRGYRNCINVDTPMVNRDYKPFRQALILAAELADDYRKAHSSVKQLSDRQIRRMQPIMGFKLLAEQFKNKEPRPEHDYRNRLADKIAYAAAVRFYSRGDSPEKDWGTCRKKGHAILADMKVHQNLVNSLKAEGIIDRMLEGRSREQLEMMLQKSGGALAELYKKAKADNSRLLDQANLPEAAGKGTAIH